MTDAPLMLGVSGLRGIVGKSLTPEVAARFAEAFGGWLSEHRTGSSIVVARDGRAGGQALYDEVTTTLMGLGCDVLELGVAMTPTAGVAVDRLGALGAVIVTASHNPQEWNGLKLLVRTGEGVSAQAPGPDVANEVISKFRNEATNRQTPGSRVGNASHAGSTAGATHLRLVLDGTRELGSDFPLSKTCEVVLDSVNGAGGFPGKVLLEQLGCGLHHLGNDVRSGTFPHPPEPIRENLTSLCGAVKYHHASIGFAQDPDADRLAIVDERGEYIGEEYTLALAAESLLSAPGRGAPAHRKPAVLVTNLSTSRMLDDIAAAHGARVIRTPVGEANVVEAMKREKAAGHDVILGGEGNGGVIWPKVTYVRDSLSAMALVLSLMARTGKKVSELVAAIPAYAIDKRKVDLARKEDARPAVEKIAAAYRDQKIDLQDGVRVDWLARKAWLHVRASNTEPIMRLIAEAPTAAESRAILDEAARVIAG